MVLPLKRRERVHVNVNVPERESGAILDLHFNVPTSSPNEYEVGKTALVSRFY